MANANRFKRGFKADAERKAKKYREDLDLEVHEALPARLLAEQLETVIISPDDVPGLSPEHLKILTQGDTNWWSAGILLYDLRSVIVLNTQQALVRQESSIMHEVSHKICEHKSGGVRLVSGIPLRTFNDEHEDEAKYLGACLQIPRDALIWAIKQGMTNQEIAKHFGASEQIVLYRRNVTGIDMQLRRSSLRYQPRYV